MWAEYVHAEPVARAKRGPQPDAKRPLPGLYGNPVHAEFVERGPQPDAAQPAGCRGALKPPLPPGESRGCSTRDKGTKLFISESSLAGRLVQHWFADGPRLAPPEASYYMPVGAYFL